MKKRILPIPLILLIPIVLLVLVTAAGIYRFSLNDEDILAKYPSHQQSVNEIVLTLFDVKTSNPWTIQLPETNAFAFIETFEKSKGYAFGRYDSGLERGSVYVDTTLFSTVTVDGERTYVAPMWISNQGSGVFYYLAQFQFDAQRNRVILKDSLFVGDRIQLTQLEITESGEGEMLYLGREKSQAMSVPANKELNLPFILTKDGFR